MAVFVIFLFNSLIYQLFSIPILSSQGLMISSLFRVTSTWTYIFKDHSSRKTKQIFTQRKHQSITAMQQNTFPIQVCTCPLTKHLLPPILITFPLYFSGMNHPENRSYKSKSKLRQPKWNRKSVHPVKHILLFSSVPPSVPVTV